MSNTRRTSGRNTVTSGKRGNPWEHFRRTCGVFAQVRHVARADERGLELSVREEPFSELLADLHVQLQVQRQLATEYAAALDSCQRLQEHINHRSQVHWEEPSDELDSRLEREVLELAVCEEAYELVSEELDVVRSELERRGLPAH